MTRERVDSSHYPSYFYCLPDGLTCNWAYLPKDINHEQLINFGEEAASTVDKTGQETRICIDSAEKVEILGNYLRATGKNVVWGGNRYFEVPLQNLGEMKQRYEALNWDAYEKNYFIDRLDPANPHELEIYKSLILGSFGVDKTDQGFIENQEKIEKINHIFDASVRIPNQSIYFIKSRDNEKVLGAFVLKYLPDLAEVQLHCVSGRSNHPEVVQIDDKMRLIMAAVLTAVDDEFPQSRKVGVGGGEIKYSGVEKLTWSTSGERRLKLYSDLRFDYSERSGLVIYASG